MPLVKEELRASVPNEAGLILHNPIDLSSFAYGDRFYALMDELPEAYAARKIHPADLTESGNKLFDFLSGWLGGPQRYIEKHGHPMLRRRHFPYAIGPQERDEWLLCMRLALEETPWLAASRGGEASRVISAPNLAIMTPGNRTAWERNERSAHEPRRGSCSSGT